MRKKPNQPVELRRAVVSEEDRRTLLQAQENHDPTLEPYASMTREQILALMTDKANPPPPTRWAFLEQFLLDKMTPTEHRMHDHAVALGEFLIREYDAFGSDEANYFSRLSGKIARMIDDELSALRKPQDRN